ncbi:MAG: peptidoglycan editing factor PgeF [Pseudobdellovibrionaceae bacterium]
MTIVHRFFTRHGGVSSGLYASLNCSPQSQDDPACVAENRARALAAMEGAGLSTLKQIHSPNCRIVAGDCTRGTEEGDALVTATSGQVLGVLTADCAPVLFRGKTSGGQPVIGAAHAGWGGALKGVLETTLGAMEELGALRGSIEALVGPCIAPQSYEVDAEFCRPFLEEDKGAAAYFTARGAKFHFDLPAYVMFRLMRAGLTQMSWTGHDTYAEEADYFSFRRATHRGENDYGRQVSAIMIRKD